MSIEKEPTNASRVSLRLAKKELGDRAAKSALPRQFVTFTFFFSLPEWRMLSESERDEGKKEFLAAVEASRGELLINTYSIVGLRTNADFMIWRIGYSLDPIQEMAARLNRTGLGRYLEATQSFLSMTKRSMYIDKDNPEHVEDRLHIIPGKSKYLFVYPFVKTRDWYTRSVESGRR